MVKTILINEYIKNTAIEHAKKRMNYEFNRFNQDDDFRFNMILIGTLGELVFESYLKSQGTNFKMEFQAGEYDSMDFEVKNKIIEIKTSGYSGSYERLNLLYNSNQYVQSMNKGFDYVVQIFINGFDREAQRLSLNNCNKAVIVGYIEHKNIASFAPQDNTYYPNHKINLKFLKDVDEIL